MKTNFNKTPWLFLFIVFAFTACTTADPQIVRKRPLRTAVGAGAGASGEGGIGVLTADDQKRRRNVLLHAGVGSLAGGGIGYYMDVMEAKLRRRLRNSGIGVDRVGNRIHLTLPDKIAFAGRSTGINPDFHTALDTVAALLREYGKTTVDVIGHTDSVGSATFNQRLSEKRARIIAEYLSGRGILPARLLTAGRGESRPVASNATPEGRNRNRRVDLQIAPITAK